MKHTLRFRKADKIIFDQIKNGAKKVETRAATVKYKNMKTGDTLVLVCDGEKLERKIKKATIFATIDSMLRKYNIWDIMPGFSTKAELEKAYNSFPGYREKLRKCGLIALEL